MKVHIAIDRLVLDGVPLGPADRARLLTRVESELTRVLCSAHAGLAAANHVAERVAAPAFNLPHSADVQRLGTEIAAAIHASITGGGR